MGTSDLHAEHALPTYLYRLLAWYLREVQKNWQISFRYKILRRTIKLFLYHTSFDSRIHAIFYELQAKVLFRPHYIHCRRRNIRKRLDDFFRSSIKNECEKEKSVCSFPRIFIKLNHFLSNFPKLKERTTQNDLDDFSLITRWELTNQ